MQESFRFALATAPFPTSIEHAIACVETFVEQAAEQRAALVCFPESYVPGMRGIDEPIALHSAKALDDAVAKTRALARRFHTAVILPMDRDHPQGVQNAAAVISAQGELLGYQTKNQLDPGEDAIFIPGKTRELFEVSGVTFGISICHEGFRYPESVRWAARRGASIVFHPHCTGSNRKGRRLSQWRGEGNAFFEHAMMCRALENEIFFASVNYAFAFQESATCVIDPAGQCIAFQPYAQPGLLIAEIDVGKARRTLASRYNPEAYH